MYGSSRLTNKLYTLLIGIPSSGPPSDSVWGTTVYLYRIQQAKAKNVHHCGSTLVLLAVEWPKARMDYLTKEFQAFQAFAERFSAVATERLDRFDGGTYFSRLYQVCWCVRMILLYGS